METEAPAVSNWFGERVGTRAQAVSGWFYRDHWVETGAQAACDSGDQHLRFPHCSHHTQPADVSAPVPRANAVDAVEGASIGEPTRPAAPDSGKTQETPPSAPVVK